MVKNLHTNDIEKKQVAEQFLCICCSNLVIPDYKISHEGVIIDSIKLPYCQNCDALACY